MLSVFFCFLRLVRRRFFAVLLFLGSLFENIFGSELLSLGVVVGLVFSVLFCLGFCFIFWQFAPETVWKTSLDVRSASLGLVLSSLGFFDRRRFFDFLFVRSFSRDKVQVVTGHPRTRLFSFSFFFFLSRRGWFIARFGRAAPCLQGVTLGDRSTEGAETPPATGTAPKSICPTPKQSRPGTLKDKVPTLSRLSIHLTRLATTRETNSRHHIP